MENRGIPELEEAARKYAAIRDKRMALNDAEVKLQDILLALLKKHGKREYRHGELEIWIKVEVEKVNVRVHEDDEPPSEKEKYGIRDETNPAGANRKGRKATGPSDSSPQEAQPADRQAVEQTGTSEGAVSQTEPGEAGGF